MCIAILSPKGTSITAQQFKNCWDNNNNGAGFMYNDSDNKLHVVKEMDSYDRIYKKYTNLLSKFPDATFVLHFRISTHGVINKSNCHPFKVTNELGFVHNGVIRAVDKDERYSDTNVFNRQILRKIPGMGVEFMSNPAINTLFGEFIAHSKLIFMNNFGETTITNEHKGDWEEDGIWYSNDSHKRVKKTVDYGGETLTREELSKRQSGGVSNKSGKASVGYQYPTWNENDKLSVNSGWGSGWSYPRDQTLVDETPIKGSIYDLHDDSNVSAWDWNAKDDENHGTYEGSNYIVSDGSITCQSCGIHSLNGELMSSSKECLECVSKDESEDIKFSASSDGALLEKYGGTSIVKNIPKEEVDNVACDNCTSVVKSEQSLAIEDWNCTLCSNCIDDFIEADAIDESMRINQEPKYTFDF